MTRAFAAVNRYLGWGEPRGGLWFVGLEEADEWACPSEQAVIDAAERLGEVSPPVADPNFEALGPLGRQIRNVIARIMSAVSREARSKQADERGSWYLNNLLWRPGSMGFQANLYPLGKPNRDAWPDGFKALYGFGADDRAEYERVVASTRFRRLAELWRESRPLATVCFGKEAWPQFRSVFGVASQPRELAGGKVHAHDAERLVLMYFPSRGHVSYEDADEIGRVLQGWGVEIP